MRCQAANLTWSHVLFSLIASHIHTQGRGAGSCDPKGAGLEGLAFCSRLDHTMEANAAVNSGFQAMAWSGVSH